MKRIISTEDAPEAVGAYSQATESDSLVFTAGQIPLTPDGELLDDAPIAKQTEQALDNVRAILREADTDLENVLKITVFLAEIDDFGPMNDTYADYFDSDPPARSAFEVANLPKGVGIEIEAVASK